MHQAAFSWFNRSGWFIAQSTEQETPLTHWTCVIVVLITAGTRAVDSVCTFWRFDTVTSRDTSSTGCARSEIRRERVSPACASARLSKPVTARPARGRTAQLASVMAHRMFESKEQAASYWKYRVAPSEELIQRVLGFLEKRVRTGEIGGNMRTDMLKVFLTWSEMLCQRGRPFQLALDVGCGSGQGTLLLAKHFASVVGTDISPAQLEVAVQHAREPNITYR